MWKVAAVGLVGVGMAAGLSGFASAAEDMVTPRLVIESVADDAGYAVSSVRGVDLSSMTEEALAEPKGGTEITGTVAKSKPAAEEKVASAAAVIPTVRPDFESSKSVTTEPVKRKVVKANARIEKRRVTLPMPPIIGAFR